MSHPTPTLTRWHNAEPADRGAIEAAFDRDGLAARAWSHGPGHAYGWHDHPYHKALYCVSGSIVFHTATGDVALGAGDRLDLPPGTKHAATVGAGGVECIEAAREG